MGGGNGATALVALRAKQGEIEALDNVVGTNQARTVQILIDLEPVSPAPATQLRRVESIARSFNRHGSPIMVDASDVDSEVSFGRAGPLGSLADRLTGPADLLDTEYPVPFIPVIRANAENDAAAFVGRLSHELGSGAALRCPASTTSADLDRVVDNLDVDPRLLDVIIDFKYIDDVSDADMDRSLTILGMINEIGPVRSSILLSGSIPSTLARTALWQQPRYEEMLWRRVTSAGAHGIRFGDYGAVHPFAGKAYPSKHVNIKYSSPNGWLFGRERMPTDDYAFDGRAESTRARTLRRVCQQLVVDDNFAGPAFSWGDHQLDDAARGRGAGLGSTSKPVAFSTSHHLAYLGTIQAAA